MPSLRVLPYRNAMEPLAASEVDRQLEQLSPAIANSINRAEAIAYALNRLPPLYATSVEGWLWQQQQAKETLGDLIAKAAGWGIKAAQRKPGQISTPLLEASESEAALQQLKELLGCEQLTWQNLVAIVEQTLIKTELSHIYSEKRSQSFNSDERELTTSPLKTIETDLRTISL